MIRFYLDDQLVELTDVDPNRTVLQWLREDRLRTGTKEGCAEGDCGACAVVVAEIDASGDALQWRAINSCIQFLPTLDGKQLVTAESLVDHAGKLHPVQQAMVDCHGSQCGFCTPGFVMALFALYQTQSQADRVDIDNALAGNLCRCTGYRPIVAAGQQMYELDTNDNTRSAEFAGKIIERLASLRDTPPLTLHSAGKRYFAPASADELADMLQDNPDAVLLAGGTDVGLWVTKDHRELDTVIYVGAVDELQQIEHTDTHLTLGSAVTLTDAFVPLCGLYPEVTELLLRFAGPPIRNAATLGGNIANGSPIGDSMPVLIALGTTLVLRAGRQTRELPLEEFYLAYKRTALARGEFVEKICIPRPSPGQQLRTYKISKRFDQDISAVCAAFCLNLQDNIVTQARVAFGGVAAIPARAPQTEAALLGQAWDEQSVRAAMPALDRDFTPLSDMRATAGYRAEISRNLLLKFYFETAGREQPHSLYLYGR